MLLLGDIGNTHTHLALASFTRVIRQANIGTSEWRSGKGPGLLRKFCSKEKIEGSALCSVVPTCTRIMSNAVEKLWRVKPLELNFKTLAGVGIDYPKPSTIGPDRLANAVAAHHRFGAPCLAIDFGTATTFDVVDHAGNFAGGVIAPGIAATTEYLHEKTALLPRVRVRPIATPIGKSTEEAILAAAVYGYRGLVRGLIEEIKRSLKVRRLAVVATGGYADLIASKLPLIYTVDPSLTLDGLRLVWCHHHLQPL